ncbi:MAG TPA: acyltransferase [Mycobacteriales bacterium]|nr:acyltransferase [Mycobacteriales bacterium]
MSSTPDAAPTPSRRITYVPALDGLRGVSLPGTIYTHFQILLSALPTAPFWLNHSGPLELNIEMFFVLSGALITSLLVSEYQRKSDIALDSFYLRRSRRLGPALIAVVPALLITQYAISPGGNQPLGHSPWLAVLLLFTFVGNWHHTSLGWLTPAWTLGIEEQFYLTWPTVLRISLRRGWVRRHVMVGFWVVIVVSLLVGAALGHHYGGLPAIYMTPTQVPPILMGCALGYALTTNPDGRLVRLLQYRATALVGLAGMVVLSALLWDHFTVLVTGGYALYGALACLLIGHCLAVADRPSIVSRFFGWRPFVVIGQVSYEAYLVHVIVIVAVLRAAPTMNVSAMVILDVVLIAVISGAFYYLIERPIRRRGWRGAFRSQPDRAVKPEPLAVPRIDPVAEDR